MKKEEKKNGSWLTFVIFIVVMVIASVGESEEMIYAVIPLVAIAVVALIVIGMLKSAKKKAGSEKTFGSAGNSNIHSHDRLTESAKTIHDCGGLEHYKKQLDGFLAAGIIERSEYNVLLQKYSRQLGKKS